MMWMNETQAVWETRWPIGVHKEMCCKYRKHKQIQKRCKSTKTTTEWNYITKEHHRGFSEHVWSFFSSSCSALCSLGCCRMSHKDASLDWLMCWLKSIKLQKIVKNAHYKFKPKVTFPNLICCPTSSPKLKDISFTPVWTEKSSKSSHWRSLLMIIN